MLATVRLLAVVLRFTNEPPSHGPEIFRRPRVQADWDFTAIQQAAEYGFLLGQEIANR